MTDAPWPGDGQVVDVKTHVAGNAVLLAGVVSGILERTFYGYVDENNVLQESFFLPLAFILIFLGGGLIVFAAGWYLKRKLWSTVN